MVNSLRGYFIVSSKTVRIPDLASNLSSNQYPKRLGITFNPKSINDVKPKPATARFWSIVISLIISYNGPGNFFILTIGNLTWLGWRVWRRFSPGLRSSERTGLGSSGFDEPEGFEGFDEPEGLEGFDEPEGFEGFDETAVF
ncbi:hypothetical protein CTI12_AA591690 [Artemisia annua]|uniref:Uncharacterized protein n=1 Tax=Artemisia annua TaxID=35608 RepID=A0A2U1KKP0_ARTAN|nr:hypothetical protein CTI12_AA591690 [Artemisia annua]